MKTNPAKLIILTGLSVEVNYKDYQFPVDKVYYFPEQKLHPHFQRQIAKYIAGLVNEGNPVLLVTHSDYIIKEINTLIMLNQSDEYIKVIKEREGYLDSELLNAEDVAAYEVTSEGLIECSISQELGIEVPSFDKEIEDMNRIQESIVWDW